MRKIAIGILLGLILSAGIEVIGQDRYIAPIEKHDKLVGLEKVFK
ncbi:MAG: hypothetical protein BWY31_01110 [Lentisphaerae bacterium ADurb.Bin242]|nr:MAG: hypothetical protein BWY31_01110 [Lentisphaerae bacterium ADurb.Bin242]